MDECYPDNPCTNFPDTVADWCPRCKTAERPTVCIVTCGENAYTDEYLDVYVTLEAARIDLKVEAWEQVTCGKGDNVFTWYEGEAREWHGEGEDRYSTARKYRAKIEPVRIPRTYSDGKV